MQIPNNTLSNWADSLTLDMGTMIKIVRGGFRVLFAKPFGTSNGSRASVAYAEGFIDALDRLGFTGMGNDFAIRSTFIDVKWQFEEEMTKAHSPKAKELVLNSAIEMVVHRLLSNTTADFPEGLETGAVSETLQDSLNAAAKVIGPMMAEEVRKIDSGH
tara:strand:+ start:129 stop:605 length:477 start_codon:yes stop_codon:yes gene_type:complete